MWKQPVTNTWHSWSGLNIIQCFLLVMKYTIGSSAPSYIFHNQHTSLNSLYTISSQYTYMHTSVCVSVLVKYITQMSTAVSLTCLGPSFQKMTLYFWLHGSLQPINLEKNLKPCMYRYITVTGRTHWRPWLLMNQRCVSFFAEGHTVTIWISDNWFNSWGDMPDWAPLTYTNLKEKYR